MPRPNRVVEGIVGGGDCKVRKRIFPPSSSSSTSILHSCRIKRAVFIGKRGGLSTPFPDWKMDSGSPSTVGVSELSQQPHSRSSVQGPVSARKLANALWELSEMPSPVGRGRLWKKRCKKETRRSQKISGSIQSGSLLPSHLGDPSHSLLCQVADQSSSRIHRRRKLGKEDSCKPRSRGTSVDFPGYRSLLEFEMHSGAHSHIHLGNETRSLLMDLKKGLSTSKEFLNVVDHFCGLEKSQHSYIASSFSALGAELERACKLVDQLIKIQRQDKTDLGHLSKRRIDGNGVCKKKEQEKIQEGVELVLEELEIEKKLRKRMERQNEKLAMELAEAKNALLQTRHDMENEKRSREAVEHVCNQLVRGIGEDKAQVEEMKRESLMFREDLEREREMLQLADTWREERVHMKLAEAKFQLEEKNAAVDQLRNELEEFLAKKRSIVDSTKRTEESPETPLAILLGEGCKDLKNIVDQNDGDGSESADSDLHSIELNMDNGSKCYRWSFAKDVTLHGRKSSGIEADSEAALSKCEALTRNRFSPNFLNRSESGKLVYS